jgi:stage V sporulation protein R
MGEVKPAQTPLNPGPNWTVSDLENYMEVFAEIAEVEWGLSTFPNQIEIICSEQMIDAHATIGLPVNVAHWRYGKHFEHVSDLYREGRTSIAYEMVINSNPFISYFLE